MFEIDADPSWEPTMRGDTGSPRADAEADFLRARRLQVIAALTARLLRKESGDRKALSFQEVVDALGLVDEVALGRQMIPVEQIVGSVDRVREFDPKFRPRTGLSRQRFERIDEAVRRGEPLPPIDVYQIGDIYFVRDGHHRVAVHRALDLPEIEADVRLVRTVVEPDDVQARSDLAARELRKLFLQRVPVPRSAYYALDPQRSPAVPVVRGDGGGLGRAADVRRGHLPGPPRGRATLVHRGVRAGRRK